MGERCLMSDHSSNAGSTGIGEPVGAGRAAEGSVLTVERPMVRMGSVQKWFGSNRVLRDIDLDIGKGEVVVVLGPSGSGKATLCRAINRLEPIDEGTIELDGVELPEEGKPL